MQFYSIEKNSIENLFHNKKKILDRKERRELDTSGFR